ncbi:hypothetical protein ACQEVZ_51565 [Dactylosporangium sp. CA-152071]|uniref:hypothetical protein n=1 Tax=Dactylosporangium sp. CA-152071 TaxID=3239933 RepID=UPI003D8FD9A5
MVLPDDFVDRVRRLPDPERFVRDMAEALDAAERAAVRAAEDQRFQDLFERVVPAQDRLRFVAIVNPRLHELLVQMPPPGQRVTSGPLAERLRWLDSDDPDAVARRAHLRCEHDARLAEVQQRRDEVGRPTDADLVDWLARNPYIALSRRLLPADDPAADGGTKA